MSEEPKRLDDKELAAALYDVRDYGLNDWCNAKLESIEQHITALGAENAALRNDLENLRLVHSANLDRLLAEMRRTDAAEAQLCPLQKKNDELHNQLRRVILTETLLVDSLRELVGDAEWTAPNKS